MATLMSEALTLLNDDIGDSWSSTTTAAGDAGKTYLVDDALYEKVADWVKDGMIVYLPDGPSGSGSAETRVVASLDSSNRLTAATLFSAQVQTSVDYEVHRLFTRVNKLTAFRQAARLMFPAIHAVVRDMTKETTDYKYEFDISSLAIFQNRPHQVLLAQHTIEDIWVADTVYAADAIVRPTALSTFTGYTYICTTAGTSHAATEPTWPTASAGTVVDGTVTWTRQDTLDYSNFPFLPLHDWDVTPDGKLFLNSSYSAGYKIMIVGIKPLAFTGSGATETVALDEPYTKILSAQAATWLFEQRLASASATDVQSLATQMQAWQYRLAMLKTIYWMKPPDGTIISGPGLTV